MNDNLRLSAAAAAPEVMLPYGELPSPEWLADASSSTALPPAGEGDRRRWWWVSYVGLDEAVECGGATTDTAG